MLSLRLVGVLLIHCYCINSKKEIYHSHGVSINDSEDLTINCSNGTAGNWFDFVKNVNVSENPVRTVIIECPAPNTSLRHIFDSIDLKVFEFLELKHQTSVYRLQYLKNLPFLKSLDLRSNGLTEIPDLDGVWNLERLLLNDNKIEEILAETFKNVTKLQYLNLENNLIGILNSGALGWLKNLKEIQLGGNRLKMLSYQMFSGLRNLEILNLSNNILERVDTDSLYDLTSLRYLDLSLNKINRIPDDFFKNTLKVLNLTRSYDPNSSHSLTNKLFSKLESLQQLYLDGNNIPSLPDDIFFNTVSLKNLSLSGNNIELFPANIFANTTELWSLKLDNNKIVAIDENLFKPLLTLKELHLNNNFLQAIARKTFSKLSKLRILNLSHNNLKNVDREVFNNLKDLTDINLSYNSLYLEDNIFLPLTRLEQIILSHNNIEDIYQDWVYGINLRYLDLSFNQIKRLDAWALQILSHYPVTVNLTYNAIETIDFNSLPVYVVGNDERLNNVKFFIDQNPIKCGCRTFKFVQYVQQSKDSLEWRFIQFVDSDQVFCHGPTEMNNRPLSELNLTEYTCPMHEVSNLTSCSLHCDCNYRPLDHAAVVNCSNKVNRFVDILPVNITFIKKLELDLSNNELQNVEDLNLSAYKILQNLVLSYNNISRLSDSDIWSQLKVLNLNSNHLERMDAKVLKKLKESEHLESLALHDNPWICDCDTVQLWEFLRSHHKKIINISSVKCAGDGRRIDKLSKDELCGISLSLIITCSLIAILGILFGLLIAFYYRYQYDIRVWLFAHNIILVVDPERKRYDAFISYSHEDESFVSEILTRLEGDAYKLCVHFRDWIVGESIQEQIARSIDESSRTIVILSQYFLESQWGQWEFRTAHMKAKNEKCDRLIVIVKDDISTDKLDSELKSYLTEYTYLKWDDPWFWDKLRYALPHKRNAKRNRRRSNAVVSEEEPLSEKKTKLSESKIVKSVEESVERKKCMPVQVQDNVI